MQEISSLIKYFIRCANKRSPRLKCSELLLHVTDTVKDPTKCAAYGADYSSILLKDILTVRKYWCEITPQQWAELLSIYFNLYLKPNCAINRLLAARIIQTLTRGCCLQTEVMHSKFFSFFSAVMHRLREERNLSGLDQIFAALNIFLTKVSLNYRMRVCKLGEDVFPIVLRVWTQNRPKDALKEEIVEFFRLMLRVHHPRGAKTAEEEVRSDHDSEYESEASFVSDSPEFQATVDSLIEAVNHALKVDDDPKSAPDHAVSFTRTKRSHKVFASHPDFLEIVRRHRELPDKRFTGAQSRALYRAIDSLRQSGVIVPVPEHERFRGFYSNLVTKKDGTVHPILDLKLLNKYVKVWHFRMDSLWSVISSMDRGEFLASIDIKDAYLHIPIFLPHQMFLRFAIQEDHFQFTALPFGLATAPRVFTKVMAAVMAILHSRGVVMLPYLDDLLSKVRPIKPAKQASALPWIPFHACAGSST
ncbi:unnamed protein product [Ranitomeya imitator]|uniref:ribonuclease H n=1 Tax=Ranitomeya imitator TaxID=111125 RepID=A0ABN9M1R2_9NEOB|nr:unnamed protein product [Ranitomeya imitator]